jgi:hypothetical protein
MNPITAILEALKISTQINSRRQLAALGMILAAIVWSLNIFYQEAHDRLRVTREVETQVNIVQMRLSVPTIAVFELSADNNQLDPVWTWDADVKSDALTEFYRVELFQQLRQGDCDIDESVAKDENGVLLPGLVCPIFRRGKLIGAIAGAYYTMPLKDSRGEIDPDAAELYRLGTFLVD